MGKLLKECNAEKWEQIRTHPYYKRLREYVLGKTEKFLVTDPPRLKYSRLHMYEDTGERMAYQNEYYEYRTRMEHFLFAYMLTEEEKYIEPLADIIWNICDIEAWTPPAHVRESESIERRRRFLDLGSTAMGFKLAEALYLVGDKLPELVCRRAKYELRERIIKGYETDTFGWMKTTNNWAAVCIAGVLGVYLYIAEKEEIDAQIPRMLETIKGYLRGFDDEGCCLEGYGYWSYGFSHFCTFAELLYEYTDGEIDLFDDPKVHEIARFQQNMAINESEAISFSDAGTVFKPSVWLSHFLKKKYPDLQMPSMPFAWGGASLRDFLWDDPALAECEMKPKSKIFHNSQWLIYRDEKYNFACKAGYNAEPHNHNDIGSFMISKNGKVTFTDPGKAEYTRQYFSAERYKQLVCSSRGHSVPIINGEAQVKSDKRSVIYDEAENRYAFSMENGYAIPTLTSLRRDFVCDPEGISLTDEYDFTETPESIIERFVSCREITVEGDGTVYCGDSVLKYDAERFETTVSVESVQRAPGSVGNVWLLDLKLKKPEKKMVLSFRFE